MKHLKTYQELHEGDLQYTAYPGIKRKFNGIEMKLQYEVEITKPDLVEFRIWIRPTKEELASMGIWSESYVQNPGNGFNIYYGVKVFEEEEDFENWGISSVRELTSDDVIDMFSEGMRKDLKEEYTPEDLLAAVVAADEHTDWILLTPNQGKVYKLLAGIGGI